MSSLTHPSRTPFLSWMTVGVALTFVLVGTLNIPHRVHHIGTDTRQLAGSLPKAHHDDASNYAHHHHEDQAPSSHHPSGDHEDDSHPSTANTSSSSCVLASFVLNNHLLQTDPLSLIAKTHSCNLLKPPIKKFHKTSIESIPPSRAPPRSTVNSIFS